VPYLAAARKFETTHGFDDRRWENRMGLDVRWSLSSHSQVDLSLRPDFGQVEVDQAVLNLDTVETFFPEKRPFFLEGMDLFRVAGPDLFYSRRIGHGLSDPSLNSGETLLDRPGAADISAAAKYTAKYGNGTQVGLLGTRVEPATALVLDSSGHSLRREMSPLTNYGVLRVQQLLDNRGSYVGGFVSGMHQAGPGGRLAQVQAMDGVFRTEDRSGLIEGTLSRSQTGLDQAQGQGWRGHFRARRDWRNGWNLQVQGASAGRTYDPNDLGYLGRADEQSMYVTTGQEWDQPWRIFRDGSCNLGAGISRDQAGHVFSRNLNLAARTDFTNFVSLWGGGGVDLAAENDRELRTYEHPVKKYLATPSIPYASLGIDSPANRAWYGRIQANRAWHPGGPSTDWTLFQSLKPGPAIEIQLSTAFTQEAGEQKWLETPVTTPLVGLRHLNQVNQTLRVAYAFTPNLTVQFFTQWLDASWNFRDLQHYVDDHTLTPGLPIDMPLGAQPQAAFSYRTWTVNLITRWEFRPGSTCFLVYTHGTNTGDLINDRASLAPGVDLAVLQHLPSDDSVQAKISWLFR
jgi:hypothetical protein